MFSGVQSHKALGVAEKYHSFLRNIYRKVRQEHSNLSTSFALSLSVKAMNDTGGYNGLVPTLLVFGALPRNLVTPIDLLAKVKRMRAMKLARKELSKAVAKERVSMALPMNVPSATLTDELRNDRLLWALK